MLDDFLPLISFSIELSDSGMNRREYGNTIVSGRPSHEFSNNTRAPNSIEILIETTRLLEFSTENYSYIFDHLMVPTS